MESEHKCLKKIEAKLMPTLITNNTWVATSYYLDNSFTRSGLPYLVPGLKNRPYGDRRNKNLK